MVKRPMIDFTQQHQAQIERERREVLLAGATIDQFRNGKWPAGSTWLFAIGVVGPKGSAPVIERRKDFQ